MRQLCFTFAICGSLLVLNTLHHRSLAQNDAGRADPELAVLDVARAITSHDEFRSQMEQLKKDLAAAEQVIRERAARLSELSREMEGVEAGSEEFLKLEKQYRRVESDLATYASDTRDGILERESQIYARVYDDVVRITSSYARSKGIRIVLNIHDDPVNPADREAVLDRINRAVIFHDAPDITEQVILLQQTESPQA